MYKFYTNPKPEIIYEFFKQNLSYKLKQKLIISFFKLIKTSKYADVIAKEWW